MRKLIKLLKLVFLSIFPINALLREVELDDVKAQEQARKEIA
jgi:hypothetical protein